MCAKNENVYTFLILLTPIIKIKLLFKEVALIDLKKNDYFLHLLWTSDTVITFILPIIMLYSKQKIIRVFKKGNLP